MGKLNYLNVGCGKKFHHHWVNVDMTSNSKDVIAHNLLKGIPFPDNYFEVLYHSQVLEHFPKEKACDFIKECNRVLKPGGVIRVVVPDLENIVDEYKKYLDESLKNPNEISEANYEWILLEMYDQTVRNYSGGQMAEFLKRPNVINEKYVIDRIGYVGRKIRDNYLNSDTHSFKKNMEKAFSSFDMFKKAIRYVFSKIYEKAFPQTDSSRIGAFRLGGEVHLWMYDRYSLSKLLKDCDFEDISIKNPFESDIPDWSKYELDVKDGLAFDPTSLFIEAKKKTTRNNV
jgi:predicted SAM-dependent methyltransferase